ncbi:hypothetical protein CCYA_CCYA07G2001 [Cyanidiococcus yangmingshanensis]|nr:hypothetical protein CCYA_CCYA07G2001 [Cyanidiococcus yangmingshanensis]
MPPYHPLRDSVYFCPVHKRGILVDLVDDRWRRDTLPLEPVPLPAGTLVATEEQWFEDFAQVFSEDAEYCWEDAEIEALATIIGDWRSLQDDTGPESFSQASEMGSAVGGGGGGGGGGSTHSSASPGGDVAANGAIWATPAWRTSQRRQALLSQWSSGQVTIVPQTLRVTAMAEMLWRRHRRTAGLDVNLQLALQEPE